MNFLDIIILVMVAGFALAGFRFGLFHVIGSLIGTVAGAYVASRFYEPMAQWLMHTTGWGQNVSRVVMFFGIFFIISRAIGAAFWLIGKVGGFLLPIPFKKTINRFLGMIFGGIEGLLMIGITLYFIDKFPLGGSIMGSIAGSNFAPYAIHVASLLFPLFPEALRVLKSSVDVIENSV